MPSLCDKGTFIFECVMHRARDQLKTGLISGYEKRTSHRGWWYETPFPRTGSGHRVFRLDAIIIITIDDIAVRLCCAGGWIKSEFPLDEGEEDSCLIVIKGFDAGQIVTVADQASAQPRIEPIAMYGKFHVRASLVERVSSCQELFRYFVQRMRC